MADTALLITLSVVSYIAGFFTPYIYTRIALAKIIRKLHHDPHPRNRGGEGWLDLLTSLEKRSVC